jgi:hypothetical protein
MAQAAQGVAPAHAPDPAVMARLGGPGLVVVAFDPGVTDGWCILRVPIKVLLRRGQVGAVSQMRWTVGEHRLGSASANVLRAVQLVRLAYEDVMVDGDVLVVVQEDFSLRMMSSDPEMLEPVRWLAVWDHWAATSGGFPFPVVRQMPSEKSVVTDQRLHLWGLWVPGKEHKRDALRHALVYLRRFVSSPKLRKEAGWDG